MSQTIIVKRSGQAPLRIRGRLFAEFVRWPHEARIFRTGSGQYVVSISHLDTTGGGPDVHDAAVFPVPGDCLTYLQGRVPGAVMEGMIEETGKAITGEAVKHTPTPWGKTYIAHQDGKGGSSYYKVDGAQRSICRTVDQLAGPQDEANIDFIVRACNTHDEMLSALKFVQAWLTSGIRFIGPNGEETAVLLLPPIGHAIAKAEGKVK